jgi:hypothetical protein
MAFVGYQPVGLMLAETPEERCFLGDSAACTGNGLRWEEGKGVGTDWGRAAIYYRRGCDEGDMEGCWRLGTLYLKGRRLPLDHDKAGLGHKPGHRT